MSINQSLSHSVTPNANINSNQSSESRANYIFMLQKMAQRHQTIPSIAERKEDLKTLERLILDNQNEIAEAISKDYGHRSVHETKLVEVFSTVDLLRYYHKKLAKWAKPQKRETSVWFAGASNQVIAQPKGVIGIIVPWNYPLFLSLGPIASAIAAGNRCMIKLAKNSSHFSSLLVRLIEDAFDVNKLAVVPDVTPEEFTALPYDHLVFTGSPAVGKKVMEAASRHLTPVTLELGGKSPTIVSSNFDLHKAAKRILFTKFLNSGQTCVAPDYLFIPKGKINDFVEASRAIIKQRYTGLCDQNLTSLIDGKAYRRVRHLMEDAKRKGATLINLIDGDAYNDIDERISPHIVLNVTDDMHIMKDEIFGPLLPIKTYDRLEEAISYINDRPLPLGLYLYSNRASEQHYVVANTMSGGVSINDCSFHAAQHDMPFGGVGQSGMGHYHGIEGFYEFSKLRPIFKQARWSGIALLAPPYGRVFGFIYRLMLRV